MPDVQGDWERALKARAQLAEQTFQAGGKVTDEDMVVIALIHPEKFDILIQTKGK